MWKVSIWSLCGPKEGGMKILETRRGILRFPAYIPVTTFGDTYPLDTLIRPFLPRLAPAMLVSYHYAQQIRPNDTIRLPLWVDSGGFVGLLTEARVETEEGLGVVLMPGERIHPYEVLELQESIADVAFNLDFPIPLDTPLNEANKRFKLTIANAHWALRNRRSRDLKLYAVVQAWDAGSALEAAQEYAKAGFDGIAIGGLIPRARDRELLRSIVESVRGAIGDLPLHVLGLGKPQLVQELYAMEVDSVDSSSYVKMAADGRLWSNPDLVIKDASPTDRMHLALCNLALATGKTLPLGMAELVFGLLRR